MFIFEFHCYACGGLWISVEDLSHYLSCYLNNGVYNETRIIKQETIELINTLQYPETYDGKFQFGLGWYFWNHTDGKTYGGHEGVYPGSHATMFRCFEDGTGIIYFVNQYDLVHVKIFQRTKIITKIVFKEFTKLLFEKAKQL